MRASAELGIKGEVLAGEYLESKGFKITARNFRSRYGEIDIVCERRRQLHFVEVKTRASDSFMDPVLAVWAPKQEKIRKTAQTFLSGFEGLKFSEYQIYLDVISVIIPQDSGKVSVRHLEGAFEGRA